MQIDPDKAGMSQYGPLAVIDIRRGSGRLVQDYRPVYPPTARVAPFESENHPRLAPRWPRPSRM
ncbi:hypothetical protein [Lysobacter gummosus]|uniref:hypothetical protein n=1 Tax=Lysobacter gummosus TaxID=262324 RepID=UPI00362DF963